MIMDTAQFFDSYYNNAQINSIVVMDCDGTILNVNKAFTNNFGYDNGEIKGKNFRILFTNRDNENNKPRHELETVVAKGQSNDENYIVDNKGHAIWCTGESILVSEDQRKYIVKDIINLQAKRQLQLFLTETEELLGRIFETSKDIPMMILDGSLKIQNVNSAFLSLFVIVEAPAKGSRLSDLNHPFWNNADIKREIGRIIITNEPLKHKDYLLKTKAGEDRTVRLDSKIIDNQSGLGRKLFIIIQDITAEQK